MFFLAFGLNRAYANERAGHGNVAAFVMVSMALYGAVLATTSGGAMVSIERAAGWSRQLRLTPLSPAAYIVIKMLTALVLGLVSVVAVYAVGILTGKPSMPVLPVDRHGLCVWIGSLVFAAFGLFMGYLLPTENVMQFLGFGLALLSFARRPVHPAEPVPARAADDRRVHPALRPEPAGARAAARRRRPRWRGWPTPSSGWPSSPGVPPGGSARTPPGSEPGFLSPGTGARFRGPGSRYRTTARG